VSARIDLERSLRGEGFETVIALDEVGRGALAGPVSVGAVVIDSDAALPPVGIDDSKKLTARQRHALCEPIREWVRAHAVAHVEASRIDEVGISIALGEAASMALDACSTHIDDATVVLLDGKFDFLTPVRSGFDVRTVVGGDGSCASIAAASILAKEERDALMRLWHEVHPQYGWHTNVGYGAPAHRRAIIEFGLTDLHRRSWRLGVSD
jgi:ribonuclease HII